MTGKDSKMSNSEVGKKGGQSTTAGQDRESHRGQQHDSGSKGGQQGEQKGGRQGGNFKDDPERASEAGRKGGQSSHGGGGGRSH